MVHPRRRDEAGQVAPAGGDVVEDFAEQVDVAARGRAQGLRAACPAPGRGARSRPGSASRGCARGRGGPWPRRSGGGRAAIGRRPRCRSRARPDRRSARWPPTRRGSRPLPRRLIVTSNSGASRAASASAVSPGKPETSRCVGRISRPGVAHAHQHHQAEIGRVVVARQLAGLRQLVAILQPGLVAVMAVGDEHRLGGHQAADGGVRLLVGRPPRAGSRRRGGRSPPAACGRAGPPRPCAAPRRPRRDRARRSG